MQVVKFFSYYPQWTLQSPDKIFFAVNNCIPPTWRCAVFQLAKAGARKSLSQLLSAKQRRRIEEEKLGHHFEKHLSVGKSQGDQEKFTIKQLSDGRFATSTLTLHNFILVTVEQLTLKIRQEVYSCFLFLLIDSSEITSRRKVAC